MSDRRTSRYLCLILRHKPEVIGITLDEHGWADVEALIEGVSRTHDLDREILERIVAEDEKGRYSFNEDHTKIRANQGHSVPVDVELEERTPPEISIDRQGLIPKTRLYVHLSADYGTAVKVGQRHGRPVVYTVDSKRMRKDGYVVYRSVNGVWLTKEVPARYLSR